jgi:6-phosphogluconolactonase (cycloisomerase 2 family)
MQATAQLSNGSSQDVTSTAEWTSSWPSTATVSASGLVTALKTGPVVIAAAVGTVSGSATVTVGAAVVTGLTVTPGASTVAAGLSQQFTAMGSFSDGSTENVTGAVTWSSGTASVATVSAGLATSLAQGTSTITASSGGVSDSAMLTVTAPLPAFLEIAPASAALAMGSTTPQAFTATEVYTDHSTQDVTGSATWSVSNGLVASIDASGAASATRAGYTKVEAADGSLSATAGLAVLATPRYLYISSDSGRAMTRMAVHAQTGQPVYEGNQTTNNDFNIGGECLTTDPAGKNVYLASQILGSGGAGETGLVNQYTMDATSGSLTGSLQNPYAFTEPVGCIEFVPSGKFGYAITPNDNSGNLLVTFSVGADGSLTAMSSMTLPYQPFGLAVDPLGQYLYLSVTQLVTGGSAWIYGYRIDGTTGQLTAIQGMPQAAPVLSEGYFAFHPSGDFVYYADDTYNTISAYRVNRSTGALTLVGSVSPSCEQPLAVQFSPDGTHAYAACGFGPNNSEDAPMLVYAVGADGGLTQTGSVDVGMDPARVLADPSGKYVYVLSWGNEYLFSGSGPSSAGSVLLVFPVQSDGTLGAGTQIAGRFDEDSMAMLAGAQPVEWTPLYAYVSTSGDNLLTGYAVQANGTLTQVQSLATQASPFAASMLPWGSDLLLASQAAAPNLQAYAIGSNGTMAAGAQFGLAAQTGGLAIDPSGLRAYASDATAGAVNVYGYGGLAGSWSTVFNPTPTQPWTFTAEAGTGPVAMDPSGRYVIAANQTAKSLSLFEPAGATPTAPAALSMTPLAIQMDATGNILFVAGDDGSVHMLASNGLGTLTDEAQGSTAGNAQSLAATPDGHFVYAAGTGGLSAFAVNQQAKTLTAVTLNLGVSLEYATGVWVDPSGKFLYAAVSNGSVNAMYLFTVNADGTLTLTSSTPVATPNHATSMVFREQIQ